MHRLNVARVRRVGFDLGAQLRDAGVYRSIGNIGGCLRIAPDRINQIGARTRHTRTLREIPEQFKFQTGQVDWLTTRFDQSALEVNPQMIVHDEPAAGLVARFVPFRCGAKARGPARATRASRTAW